MKTKLLIIIFLLDIFKAFAQENFSVHIVPSAITAVPALHSGAFAERNGKWIFIGGRLDGMHNMQANMAFPVYSRNDSVFIVDAAANTYSAVSAQQLPGFLFEALCSSNMEYYQDGKYLYMIGGYGSEDSSQQWMTFPSLISVDLDSLLSAVSSGSSITNCFRQLIDSNMAVTGGQLGKIDSTYYLVFGQRFDGRYFNGVSPFVSQHYTHEIRKFNIYDDGINLSINNYSTDRDTDNYHRRDFNMVPQIYPNHDTGFTVFGGVFQKLVNQPFLTPIDISGSSVIQQQGFNENLNQYTTASLPVYDSSNNYMHTVFFGGLSLYTLDTNLNMLIQDTLVPFVSSISRVTRDSTGNLSETLMQESMPALKGTNAWFIPDRSVNYYKGQILNLNSLSGNTRVGFIAGGIFSDSANVALTDPVDFSRANTQLYEVYIDKSINAITELPVTNAVNSLLVYPNPVIDKLFLGFYVKDESNCEIKLFSPDGKLVRTLLVDKKLKGDQQFSFPMNGFNAGAYFCRVRVGNSMKVVRIEVQR